VKKLDGYYINLDRSTDRLAALTKKIEECGCSDLFQRFPAVDGAAEGPYDNRGDNSVWACRRSHETIILQSDPESATVILEDDVDICRQFSLVINADTIGHAIGMYPDMDMFFLECAPYYDRLPYLIKETEQSLKNRRNPNVAPEHRHDMGGVIFPNAKDIYAFCTSGYVVTPKGKITLRRLFDSGIDYRSPIDMMYRGWIHSGELNAHLTVPFLVAPQHMGPSTIAYEDIDPSRLLDQRENFLGGAARRMLFAGDPNIDLAATEAVLAQTEESEEYRLAMRLHAALMSRY
jgi:GR25 family glycosyltransferase involved in LPS biosynthesis